MVFILWYGTPTVKINVSDDNRNMYVFPLARFHQKAEPEIKDKVLHPHWGMLPRSRNKKNRVLLRRRFSTCQHLSMKHRSQNLLGLSHKRYYKWLLLGQCIKKKQGNIYTSFFLLLVKGEPHKASNSPACPNCAPGNMTGFDIPWLIINREGSPKVFAQEKVLRGHEENRLPLVPGIGTDGQMPKKQMRLKACKMFPNRWYNTPCRTFSSLFLLSWEW